MELGQAKKMQHELSQISASCKKYEMCYKRSDRAYGFWSNKIINIGVAREIKKKLINENHKLIIKLSI